MWPPLWSCSTRTLAVRNSRVPSATGDFFLREHCPWKSSTPIHSSGRRTSRGTSAIIVPIVNTIALRLASQGVQLSLLAPPFKRINFKVRRRRGAPLAARVSLHAGINAIRLLCRMNMRSLWSSWCEVVGVRRCGANACASFHPKLMPMWPVRVLFFFRCGSSGEPMRHDVSQGSARRSGRTCPVALD